MDLCKLKDDDTIKVQNIEPNAGTLEQNLSINIMFYHLSFCWTPPASMKLKQQETKVFLNQWNQLQYIGICTEAKSISSQVLK